MPASCTSTANQTRLTTPMLIIHLRLIPRSRSAVALLWIILIATSANFQAPARSEEPPAGDRKSQFQPIRRFSLAMGTERLFSGLRRNPMHLPSLSIFYDDPGDHQSGQFRCGVLFPPYRHHFPHQPFRRLAGHLPAPIRLNQNSNCITNIVSHI